MGHKLLLFLILIVFIGTLVLSFIVTHGFSHLHTFL